MKRGLLPSFSLSAGACLHGVCRRLPAWCLQALAYRDSAGACLQGVCRRLPACCLQAHACIIFQWVMAPRLAFEQRETAGRTAHRRMPARRLQALACMCLQAHACTILQGVMAPSSPLSSGKQQGGRPTGACTQGVCRRLPARCLQAHACMTSSQGETPSIRGETPAPCAALRRRTAWGRLCP